ncbi:RraA family protein [Haliangium ochraceum]|uniref:Putative 4-hydroxy-4-methyl-2-oxoglutarate aldolase n=1 Tax=Haliangium ochraceum (strain DSM 14365 / JCM 11303 / SMP-2) TaxID=502025 RepID=D0LRX1_HALO1|nr:RraA family protein [Haliangium ochraceum]ACY13668.1 Dimethylmenaquinone methyltransferase [Haliangium ochraceum DSM 14365]
MTISTTSLSDALDMAGLGGQVHPLRALVPGARCAGPAFTVRFEDAERPGAAPAANYLEDTPPGSVVVIDNSGRTDCTVWGGLLTAFATHRRVAGTVIWGACRDLAEIRALAYPMFALRPYMRTGKGRVRCAEVGGVVRLGEVEVAAGDWIVADDDGVVRVAAERWSTIAAQSRKIEAAEERILADVHAGIPLAEARRRHRYDHFKIGNSHD